MHPGQEVTSTGRSHRVPVGASLLGRVIDGLGRPIDGRGPLHPIAWSSPFRTAPDSLTRTRITAPLVTGQRVIDGLLTCGRGQRIGLFAGSGVGKSTLMGQIARVADADCNVIALIGERGREVRPFLEDCLGETGLEKSVVVVATADEAPLLRIRAAETAITIADYFRSLGGDVLYLMDSMTRVATAQREISLSLGEPPGARGYPPSVQILMSRILEQLGTSHEGSITGIITVLVDGDDTEEPIADAARSILDGHVVLDRKLAAKNHFPAVNVLASVSRVFPDVANR